MSDLTLILLAAGNSSRFGLPVKKQWLRIGHDPLWQFVADQFNSTALFSNIIITAHKEEVPFMQGFCDYTIVEGGESRQQSLKNALAYVDTPYVLVSDIARACIDTDLIHKLVDAKDSADVIVPTLSLSDTVVYEENTIDRDKVKRIQTPQLSRTEAVKKAVESTIEYTDESSAIVANGGSRHFIDGSEDAHKITYIHDLNKLPCIKAPSTATLVGNGFDVHAFEEGRKMLLGGIKIDVDYGFKAHSDGDVAIHALIDALLGAAGLGDIGMLFPDSDNAYKDIDSKELLKTTVLRLHQFGLFIVNADITIAAEAPRLSSYKAAMRSTLAKLLHIPSSRMNIKATTTEKLGFIGRKEGVGVMATATLNYYDWTQK
ncbi:bifunctional 2-C-methyl-D-erythritol 4-phosphate cytidylyltransferase/2-C-methyl-D-erythritol 2,4-cyclodiphosphate synthase [Sulfurimonas sp. HSL3-7]|uniref:bifunctional 2-C-methyl-D-erythritol 4-phosphate cytidylyltransferase/2-C-methyl-D-erythritol 2,4-cyclodiphosphate synthase n=1 Tax=Sulfonitrofixus jiaomeiensis TaxID=3131938 RepID=UPI0031F9C1E8